MKKFLKAAPSGRPIVFGSHETVKPGDAKQRCARVKVCDDEKRHVLPQLKMTPSNAAAYAAKELIQHKDDCLGLTQKVNWKKIALYKRGEGPHSGKKNEEASLKTEVLAMSL